MSLSLSQTQRNGGGGAETPSRFVRSLLRLTHSILLPSFVNTNVVFLVAVTVFPVQCRSSNAIQPMCCRWDMLGRDQADCILKPKYFSFSSKAGFRFVACEIDWLLSALQGDRPLARWKSEWSSRSVDVEAMKFSLELGR